MFSIVVILFFVYFYRSPIHKPCFEYLWGRKDCPSSPDGKAVLEFPQGWMTSAQSFSYFKRMFHFTTEEVRNH